MGQKTFVLDEEKGNMEIRKVLKRTDGVKYIIVPKHSQLEKGDYVKLNKLTEV